MQAALSILTAGLLFIHAAFGCCWHHAHRCRMHGDAVAVVQPTGCCEHHGHDQGEGQPRPCDCELECGSSCAYLLPQKVMIDPPQPAPGLDVVTTVPLLADAPILLASWMAAWPPGATPDVALHLLHQRLLI